MTALQTAPGTFAICRLPAGAVAPSVPADAAFWCLARTADEVSVVCASEAAPADAQVDDGWRAVRVTGTMDLALTGVLARLTAPLAEAGVPVFAVATFDTDWLLVPGHRFQDAAAAWRAAGVTVA